MLGTPYLVLPFLATSTFKSGYALDSTSDAVLIFPMVTSTLSLSLIHGVPSTSVVATCILASKLASCGLRCRQVTARRLRGS